MKIKNFTNIDLKNLLRENNSNRLNYNDLIKKEDLINISKDKLNIFFNDIINSIHKRVVELNDLFSITDFNKKDKNKYNEWKRDCKFKKRVYKFRINIRKGRIRGFKADSTGKRSFITRN